MNKVPYDVVLESEAAYLEELARDILDYKGTAENIMNRFLLLKTAIERSERTLAESLKA